MGYCLHTNPLFKDFSQLPATKSTSGEVRTVVPGLEVVPVFNFEVVSIGTSKTKTKMAFFFVRCIIPLTSMKVRYFRN